MGGIGRPPKADGCGKLGCLGTGALIPGMANMLGAVVAAPHMPVAGIHVVAGGPN